MIAGLCVLILAGCSARLRPDTESRDPLQQVPLEQQIGQLIMMGYRDSSVSGDFFQKALHHAQRGRIGGVILYGHNIPSKAALQAQMQQWYSVSNFGGLFLAIDQEGGRVQRLHSKNGYSNFPSQLAVASSYTPSAAYGIYRNMARMVSGAGFNVNFAPVVDLHNPLCPVIGQLGRAFSSDWQKVVRYARSSVRAHMESGLLPVLKHYPGHGNSRRDTHKESVDVTPYWQPGELLPYTRLIKGRWSPAVMSAHVYQRRIDAAYPASLSSVHLISNLRSRTGHRGLIFTDDLQMKAVSGHYTLAKAVELALTAGNDILLFSNSFDSDADIPSKMISIVTNLIRSNIITRRQIFNAFKRVAATKQQLFRIRAAAGFRCYTPAVSSNASR